MTIEERNPADCIILLYNAFLDGDTGELSAPSQYRAFLIRPKICCLPQKFRGKQHILGLIRKAL